MGSYKKNFRLTEKHLGFKLLRVFLKREKIMFTKICFWIMVIGGLNWGLVGLMDLNLVALLFGSISYLARIVYVLVALASIWVALVEVGLVPRK